MILLRNMLCLEKYLYVIVESALLGVLACIPFSRAGVEISAGIAISTWLVLKITSVRGKHNDLFYHVRNQRWYYYPLAIYVLMQGVSLVFSVDIILSARSSISKTAEYVLLCLTCYNYYSHSKYAHARFYRLGFFFCVVITLIFINAYVQFVTGTDFIRHYNSVGTRIRASFVNANDFAAWLIVVIPILWSLIVSITCMKRTCVTVVKAASLSIVSICLLCVLFATESRGGVVGLFIGTATMIIVAVAVMHKVRYRMAIIVIGTMCASLIIAFLYAPAIMNRFASITSGFEKAGYKQYVWQEAAAIIEDYPLVGTGPNTYAIVGPHYKMLEHTGYYPHNSYLQMAAETGILGVSAFLYFLLSIMCTMIKIMQKKGDIVLLGIFGGVVAFLVHAFFDTHLYSLPLAVLFWCTIGIVSARISLCSDALPERS